jgi:hypothetical protein
VLLCVLQQPRVYNSSVESTWVGLKPVCVYVPTFLWADAFSADNLQLQWYHEPIEKREDIILSQFSLNGFETSKCDQVYAGSMINISSIFAGANFRGSPKIEMFVDIWIRGYYYLHMTCLVTVESLLIVRF